MGARSGERTMVDKMTGGNLQVRAIRHSLPLCERVGI